MSGGLDSVEHLHYRNILNKLSWIVGKDQAELSSHWAHWQAKGVLKTPFKLVLESLAGKWESTGKAMTAISLHLDDWRKFAVRMEYYLTGVSDNMRQHWQLVVHMLHSVPYMFDFTYQFSFELSINGFFAWDKARSQICPQSGPGFRLQDCAMKAIIIKHTLLCELPLSSDSPAERDRKIKDTSPQAWVLASARSSVGQQTATGAMVCSAALGEKLLESTRRHGDMVLQVWDEQFKMYLTEARLLFGIATDHIWGPFFAGSVLYALKLGDKPTSYPCSTDTYNRHCGARMAEIRKDIWDAVRHLDPPLKEFWKDQGLGDSKEKLADWRALAAHPFPTRGDEDADELFAAEDPKLAAITPWFRTHLLSCPHSNRPREQLFSVHTHLGVAQQQEGLKEALTLYHSTLSDLRMDQLSSDLRSSVRPNAPEGTTRESTLAHTDRSAAQLQLHSTQMIKLAAVYEQMEGTGTLASQQSAVIQFVRKLKDLRELEYASKREEMFEKRRAGTRKMTKDAAAGAHKEDAAADHWASLSGRERAVAKASVVSAKSALKQVMAEGGKGAAERKRKAQGELQRVSEMVPKLAHGGSLAITRGEVVTGK